MKLTVPAPGKRTFIVGRTGSGKTTAALFHLAMQDWDQRPWFVIDTKEDEHVAQIEGAEEIPLTGKLPTEPGIYIVRPDLDDDRLGPFLTAIYQQRNCGLWIDEGYDVAKMKEMRRLLTKGRSRKISVVFLSQRPRYIDRFVISEADFFQIYDLNDKEDRERVAEFIRDDVDIHTELPEYHSWWYEVAAKRAVRLGPLPEPQASLDIIRARMPEDQLEPGLNFV